MLENSSLIFAKFLRYTPPPSVKSRSSQNDFIMDFILLNSIFSHVILMFKTHKSDGSVFKCLNSVDISNFEQIRGIS